MTTEKKTGTGKKGTVKIKQVVSFIGSTDDIRQAVRGLGLRRLHQVVEREDTPSIRGMIHKVRHLVEVVEWGNGEKGNEKRTPKRAHTAQVFNQQAVVQLVELTPAQGLENQEGSRGPRHGFEARQDRGRRQQGPEISTRIFAAPGFRGRPDAVASPHAQARLS
jgi:large subunit ribosomal protein L30